MAGEIASLVAQASSSSAWVDAPTLRSASENDASRLADLLSEQTPQSPATNLDANIITETGDAGLSMGDAILRSLDSIGRSYKSKSLEIDALLAVDGAKLSTTDLLRIQFQLIDASLQVDLVSKAISKGTQHIDQLTKLQ
jgi:type III secretion system YscI/HrpB-like protein